MGMGNKVCPYCNNCEAEALYAVDGIIEWFCVGCLAEWTEEPKGDVTSAHDKWMLDNYGET